MYNSIEEWINTPHKSVEDILEELSDDTFFNLMITEAIREDVLDNALMKFQNRLNNFQTKDTDLNTPNDVPTTDTPDFGLNDASATGGGDNFDFGGGASSSDASATGGENFDFGGDASGGNMPGGENFDFGGDASATGGENFDFGGDAGGGDLDLDLGSGGDNFDFGGDASGEEAPGDAFGMDDTEDQKDKLTSNIKQLIELRDLLDDVSSTTSDPEILKINQQLNKLLSTIANMGDSIMERDDLSEINTEMEDFIQTAVEQSKTKIEQIREKNKQDKGQ